MSYSCDTCLCGEPLIYVIAVFHTFFRMAFEMRWMSRRIGGCTFHNFSVVSINWNPRVKISREGHDIIATVLIM